MDRETNGTSEEIEQSRGRIVEAIDRGCTLAELSKLYMSHVLMVRGGNKVHASRVLGIDRRTIQRWARGRGRISVAPEAGA